MTEEQNIGCEIINLIARVEDIRVKGEVGGNQDIVAFVGLTKSGKSTLINGLMGNPLLCKMDPNTFDTYLENHPEASGPKIGADCGESETVDPASYGNLTGTDLVMWDFPGFGDNKGPDQEVLNAISCQMILQNQKSVRFAVVASHNLIKSSNPIPFYKLLRQLEQICPEISENMCIVCTKLDKGTVSGLLEKAKTQSFPNAEENQRQLIRQSQQLIGKILERKAYIDFQAPKEDEVDRPFFLPKKEEIIDCIKNLKGTIINNYPLIISDEAKLKIAKYYDLAYFIMKDIVAEMCSSLKKYCDALSLEARGAAAEGLPVYKRAKLTLESILEKATNFETLSPVLNDLGIEKEKFFEAMRKFKFIEELKYSYKMNEDEELVQGQTEFFDTIRLCVKNYVMHYSSLIAASEASTQERKKMEEENMKMKEELEKLNEELKNLSAKNAEIASKDKVMAVLGAVASAAIGIGLTMLKIKPPCVIQ